MKFPAFIIVQIALAGCLITACFRKGPVTVNWTIAATTSALQAVPAYGKVKPGRDLSLSFMKCGIVRRCMVTDGDTAETGDTLACLDNKDELNDVARCRADLDIARITLDRMVTNGRTVAEEKLTQAKINEASAKRKYERAEAMALQGSITEAQRDETAKEYAIARSTRLVVESEYAAIVTSEPGLQRARVKQAEIFLDDALIALSRTVISAPCRGKITKLFYSAGEMYTTNNVCLTLLPADTFITFEADVPVPEIGKVHIGQNAIVRKTDDSAWMLNAVVSAIIPQVDSTKGTIRVLLESGKRPEGLILPEKVSVLITADTITDAIVLGKEYLLLTSSDSSVFIKRADRAEKKKVHVSFDSEGQFIILEGLASGDTVVAGNGLEDGSFLQLGKNIRN